MKNKKKTRIFASDFETTTNDPLKVAVWSAETIEVGTSVSAASVNCVHQTNIHDYLMYVSRETWNGPTIFYFHNLKFDGSYILDYLNKSDQWHEYTGFDDAGELILKDKGNPKRAREMHSSEYTYSINDKNVIYSITLRCGKYFCEFRDSMKLLPFSLRKIAHDFNTPHKKLEMNYGDKGPGYQPTQQEMKYIENDVYVLKEALEIFAQLTGCGSDYPMTIGAECMREYKQIFAEENFNEWGELYPNLTQDGVCTAEDGISIDQYIRCAYRGGWCYADPRHKGKVIEGPGYVYDVNSLYPSMMHSLSGSIYPVGGGYYSTGDLSKAEQKQYDCGNLYFYIHIKTEFNLKPRHVPTVEIKGSFLYPSQVWLSTSDVICEDTRARNIVDLFLSCTDYALLKDHYDLSNTSIVSHISFVAQSGLFDTYINKWMAVKQQAKGAMRTLAKLMLNNLYGKFATSPDADYQIMLLNKNTGGLYGETVELTDPDKAVYIPIGAAITSYARNFTIRHAQDNYANFCYADTDSLHLTGVKTNAVNIKEHPTALCAWKNETVWDRAIFAGQKRYIEHVIKEDGENVEPYYNVKCCGMGAKPKNTVQEWLNNPDNTFDLGDFKQGLVVPGNLKSHRVCGGIRLEEKDFTFR